jgi:hypothetical protein
LALLVFAGAEQQHLQQPPATAALASSVRSIFCILITSLIIDYFISPEMINASNSSEANHSTGIF